MIDASIPLSGGNRPDPIREIFSQIQEHKLGQLKQQMYEQQLAQSQRAQEEDAQLKQLLAGGAQGQDLVAQLTGAGHLDKANALQKQLNEQESFKLERQTKIGGLMKNLTGQVLSNPTEQSAIAALDHFQRVTGENVDNEKALVYSMRNNPEGIMKWAAGHSLNADQLLPKVETKDLGGTLQTQQIDPITGQVKVTGSQAKSMTPGEIASNKIAQGNLAVNQANLGLSKERLELERQTAGNNKLVYDAKRGMMINPATGEASPVTQSGQPIGSDTQGEGVASAFKAATESLERLKAHPGTDTALGLASMFPTLGGTKAADFEAQLDAFKSQVFLPMVQSIKGMGALSDAEGKKLATAIGALSLSMSKKDFLEAATRIERDLRDKYKAATGKDLIVGSNGASPSSQEQKTFKSMPDPAQLEGKRIRADDGTIYRSNGKKWMRE